MKTIEIRLANPTDAAVIALLGRITFDQTFGHYFRDRQDLLDYFDATFSVEKIATSLTKSNNVFWLALVNGLPVGYAKLKLDSPSPFLSSEKVSQLQKIYVLKDYHQFKLGGRLQTEMLIQAQHLGYQHIWLSVLDRNARAIRFYQKYHFAQVGTHDYSIGKEDFQFLVMARKLNTFPKA